MPERRKKTTKPSDHERKPTLQMNKPKAAPKNVPTPTPILEPHCLGCGEVMTVQEKFEILQMDANDGIDDDSIDREEAGTDAFRLGFLAGWIVKGGGDQYAGVVALDSMSKISTKTAAMRHILCCLPDERPRG